MMTAAEAAPPMVEVTGLHKQFRHGGGFVQAVNGVDLRLPRGTFTAVMGASGSGKSTLLHLLAGLTRPDAGQVRIDGVDINTLGDRQLTLFRRRHIGLIFQAFNLIPSLTGQENIVLPMLLGNTTGPADAARQLADELGLGDVCARRPDSMSGGEQQRVAIARALVNNPSLVLADEPTGSLDSINGRRLCDLLGRLARAKNTTVLMVTHNPVVAFAASHFVILRDGQVVDQFDKYESMTLQDLNQRYIAIVAGERAREIA